MINIHNRLIDGFVRVCLDDWPGVLDRKEGKTRVDWYSREYNISPKNEWIFTNLRSHFRQNLVPPKVIVNLFQLFVHRLHRRSKEQYIPLVTSSPGLSLPPTEMETILFICCLIVGPSRIRWIIDSLAFKRSLIRFDLKPLFIIHQQDDKCNKNTHRIR